MEGSIDRDAHRDAARHHHADIHGAVDPAQKTKHDRDGREVRQHPDEAGFHGSQCDDEDHHDRPKRPDERRQEARVNVLLGFFDERRNARKCDRSIPNQLSEFRKSLILLTALVRPNVSGETPVLVAAGEKIVVRLSLLGASEQLSQFQAGRHLLREQRRQRHRVDDAGM